MLWNLGLKTKILGGFMTIALLAVVVGGFGYVGLKKCDNAIDEIGDNRLPSLDGLNGIDSAMWEITARQLILSNPFAKKEELSGQLVEMEASFKRIETHWKIYEPLPQTKDEEAIWKQFVPLYEKWAKASRDYMDAGKEKIIFLEAGEANMSPKVLTASEKLYESYSVIRQDRATASKLIDDLLDINDKAAETAIAEGQHAVHSSIEEILVALIIAVMLAIVLGYIIATKITTPVLDMVKAAKEISRGNFALDVNHKSGDEVGTLADSFRLLIEKMNDALHEVNGAVIQVAAGATQISEASQSLSSGATESAASVEEITTSVTQIGSQARSNAENSIQSSKITNAVRIAAEKGNAEMAGMLQAIQQVCDDGHKIATVVKMIDDIAFQTNVLSLNAAVEAARAGKHGRGFTVVADAVRGLANESAAAAKETAALVEGTIKRMDGSLAIAQQTAESLREIASNSVKASDLVSEIAVSSNEQAQGVHQIGQGLMQLNQVIQQNSSNSEEAAATAEELSGQANDLRHLVSLFRLKGNGNSGATYGSQSGGQMLESAPKRGLAKTSKEQGHPKGTEQDNRRDYSLNDNEFQRY